jgi:hypothetical protein
MQARKDEIVSIREEVSQLPAVQKVNAHLAASGGNILSVNYTITAWQGGSETYNFCSLAARAPFYQGSCVPKMQYTLTSAEAAPYACSTFPNGTSLAGAACIEQVDLQLDCAAMCECVTAGAIPGKVKRSCDTDRCARTCT